MMKFIFFVMFIFTISMPSFAIDCPLVGDGRDNTVFLRWDPMSWDKNVEGVVIKRREIFKDGKSSDWIALHEGLIVQELKLDRAFEKSVASKAEQNRLKSKLQSLVNAGNAREFSAPDYYEIGLSSESALRTTRMGFIVDYDLALLQGFGLIDQNMPAADQYEYGIFIKLKNQNLPLNPSSTYLWKYGSSPEMKINAQTTVKKIDKSTIELKWVFDSAELKQNGVSGFNIYQEQQGWKKLNNSEIKLSVSQKDAILDYKVTIDERFVSGKFKATPVSAFGAEGTSILLIYDEKSNTEPKIELNHTILTKENKISFSWKLIEGSIANANAIDLESKDWNEIKFSKVGTFKFSEGKAEILAPSEIHNRHYRLSLKKSDGDTLYSNETVIEFYSAPIPRPSGLSAVYNKDKSSILLTWDALKIPNTDIQYRVYVGNSRDETIVLDYSIPLQKSTSYEKVVSSGDSGEWKFAVSAVVDGKNSAESEIVKIHVPNTKVSKVNNSRAKQDGKKALIQWSYMLEMQPDLLGFRIYLDDALVVNEKKLTKEVRSWTSPELTPGKLYKYKISAVTTFGYESVPVDVYAQLK